MDKNQVINTGRNLITFIVQVAVFFLCLGYIEFMYLQNIAPDKEVKETYTPTTCALTQKHLSTKGHLVHHYRSDFLLSYLINGKQIQSWATGNGLDFSFTTDQASQEDALSQYNIGQTYDCWVNPENPYLVVLVMRHDWTSTFPLLLPSVIAVIVFYYILRSILIFLGLVRIKAHEINDRRKHL